MNTARTQHKPGPSLYSVDLVARRSMGPCVRRGFVAFSLVVPVILLGCISSHHNSGQSASCTTGAGASPYLTLESPTLCDQSCERVDEFAAGPPPTIRNYEQLEPWNMTLEEAVQLTLSNAKVLDRLGGRVIAGPQGTATIFDPAIQATDPFSSAEAALSAFDAQYFGSADHSHD